MLGSYQESRGKLEQWKDAEPRSDCLQNKLGILPKDTSSGPFVEEWKKHYETIAKDVEEVDIAPALSAAAFSIKGQQELVCDRLF